MNFIDRNDAGKLLAKELKDYLKATDTIVIALPRGGVIIGEEVAKFLHLPLDIVCPRKIGAPSNPELAIGAITETGEGIFSDDLIRQLEVSDAYLNKLIQEEKEKATWRLSHYRKNRPPRNLAGKNVLLVDDGLATGSTMLAAIKTIKVEKAKTIIVAVPVSPPETLEKIQKEVDKVFCLYAPSSFYAVGQFYEQFEQTTDEEVITILATTVDV